LKVKNKETGDSIQEVIMCKYFRFGL